ncbi:Holliday junction resolvase RecU [Mycoplasma sp. 2045]|uniref:Holliday junction resolvase RecU n=2 Tax=Mycoplasma TaxID=2093 RepID=UPI00211C9FFE|nr:MULTISPECIES: Holliday junction resolvase RecU [unclassified Mycoplasma]MEA4134317.1 Holliday junction resolvase RecU [Mycoplasma sp. 2704]UUM20603.1 Holliday junction resolvase RecU [Mycoplasma sp. 2045]
MQISSNNKNRGMFLEKIINNTIAYLWQENIAFIEKKSTPLDIKNIQSKTKNNVLGSFRIKKSTVDYIGMYNGQFICFEAKSTNNNSLTKKLFKKHQIEYLNLIHSNKGISFAIVYFSLYDEFYKITVPELLQYFKNKSSVKYEEIKRNSKKLFLEFPGYLTFLN